MNSPLTKYAPKQLVFFNYHEYLAETFTSLSDKASSEQTESPALVVNHFPNPYIPSHTDLFSQTRIVRIPRVFDTCDESYIVPQFSPYFPGKEPGAIASAKSGTLEGESMGQLFGFESSSPISQWLSEKELLEIVSTINTLLFDAFSPQNRWGALENGLDFFTATLYSTLYSKCAGGSRQQRSVAEVDEYIDKINREMLSKRHPLLMMVPVTTSAMLSLDFQIPMPIHKANNGSITSFTES